MTDGLAALSTARELVLVALATLYTAGASRTSRTLILAEIRAENTLRCRHVGSLATQQHSNHNYTDMTSLIISYTQNQHEITVRKSKKFTIPINKFVDYQFHFENS